MSQETFDPVVLVVDDCPNICETVALILKVHSVNAVVAYDGDEAIQKAKELRPPLILMDVGMPRMNGVDAALEIKKFLPNCKILIWTGVAPWGPYAAEKGFTEFLAKPCHPQELLDCVAAHGFQPTRPKK